MSLLDTLRKNLDSETFAKVTDALGDDFNYDMVPRTRLNKVIAQRDEARRQLADTQNGGAPADPDEGDGDDGQGAGGVQSPKSPPAPAGLSQKDLDKAVEAERKAGENRIKEMQLQFAATEKLREAKFVDPQLVLSAGLIDFSKVTTDEKTGAITGGLDDQITALAKDRPYLTGAGGVPSGTGKEGGSDNFGSVTSRDEFMKLSTDQQIAFKAANPEVFKGFMNQI
ncbi:MAG: phage scaffolding protein [Ruminococcus flavefaciens]|nr:phage scaffolding protein [Ruminococcus flavefaciens]